MFFSITTYDNIYKRLGVEIFFFAIWFFAFWVGGNAYAQIYEVGPGKALERIGSVPFDRLEPGDLVKIYYREKPYLERIILRRSGTEQRPIRIKGIPSKGRLPIIDGKLAGAVQRENWNHRGRWLIKIGDDVPGDYVRIENLVLRNANNGNLTVDSKGGHLYTANAGGVFLTKGKHVVISNCLIYACGNGIICAFAPNVNHLTVRKCRIYGNGDFQNKKSDQEHNVYLNGTHTIVEFCRFGPPAACGQTLKDRGLDTIIRYNWIEGGFNRQLDLVDHKDYKKAHAFVYGNVLVQGRKSHNYNMIHWGGDSGYSRSGTLYFFNNTVIGKHPVTRYIDVQYSDCKVDLRNNAFIGQGKLWNYRGTLKGLHNWFSKDIQCPQEKYLGIRGDNPGFMIGFKVPYFPYLGSALINNGISQVPLPVEYMPLPRGGGWKRSAFQTMDIGAYEFNPVMLKKHFGSQ
ncbi:right-handed parallel beta-helix repeat-containing protein [uncultured Desulfobacter sp.]|uniref:right-handed parallel beta-helix repeat-containing protein n=1 Tax=uncultured Desulfobacter sp. TaxID=240139 RepID=UPI0029C7A0C4|nr:right-handed parallel beta-helix repeat-containing protein [uncultured Desulfobacter sp.]